MSSPQINIAYWPTRNGVVAAYRRKSDPDADCPVVVLLHGALRQSGHLDQWVDQLEGVCDVVLLDLPGHGRSVAHGPASVAGMAETLHEAICSNLSGRNVLIVGESVGGTIALAIAGLRELGPVRAVFAADPPMTTAKLWSVARAFQEARFAASPEGFVERFGRETFGLFDGGIEEIIYYPLIGALRTPAVIATGDIPLLPPRWLDGVTCLFDPVDHFVVETFYPGKVTVEQIHGCGHLLLIDAPSACRAIILRLLSACCR